MAIHTNEKTKKSVIAIFLATIACTALLLLPGCSSKPSTVEEYLQKNPSEKEAMETAFKNQIGDLDASITVKGNEILSSINMGTDNIDTSGLDSYYDSMEDTMKKNVVNTEEKLGITGITYRFEFKDSSGNVISSVTYNNQGRVK